MLWDGTQKKIEDKRSGILKKDVIKEGFSLIRSKAEVGFEERYKYKNNRIEDDLFLK